MKTLIGWLLWCVLRVYVLVTRRKSVTFHDPSGAPYLTRWPLWTAAPWPDRDGRTGGEGWYLHRLDRSDYERALHNHPAPAVAIPLRVGYLEQRYEHDRRHGVLARLAATRWLRRLPLSVNVLTPTSFHRIELLAERGVARGDREQRALPFLREELAKRAGTERPCWSLFYIGPRSGKGWGFLQPDGTVARAAHNDGNTGARSERTDEVIL